MLDKLLEIEKKINIKKFIVREENIWLVFRTSMGINMSSLAHTTDTLKIRKKPMKKVKSILHNFSFMIRDFFKLFSNYDYILLTTTDDYKDIDGHKINRLTNELLKNEPNAKILNIMTMFQNKKINKNLVKNDTIVMYTSIHYIIKLVSFFIRVNKNSNTIFDEFKNNDIEISLNTVDKELSMYLSLKYVYRVIFKLVKPKAIITTCYSNYQVINVANSLNITTIEVQHGVMVDHFAYNITLDINKNFYPKYLLVFGLNDKEYLKDKFYIQKQDYIFSVGNLMIDHYRVKNNNMIKELKNDYEYIIAVSLQWTVAKEMIDYVVKQAKINKNICFILIPRDESDLNTYTVQMNNIKLFDNITCYEIVTNSDYHMTSYSSCATESLSLGVRNIFLNLKGFSEKYFSTFIDKNIFNYLLNHNDNIITILEQNNSERKEVIESSNSEYIQAKYKNNIALCYKKILETN